MGKAVLFSGLGTTDIVLPKVVAIERHAVKDPMILMQFWPQDRDLQHVYRLRVVLEGTTKPLDFFDPSETVMEKKRQELLAAIEAYWAGEQPEVEIRIPELGESPDLEMQHVE